MQNQDLNLCVQKRVRRFSTRLECNFFKLKSKVATVDSLVTMEGLW